MTYNAIHYAENHGVDNRRGMKGFYQALKDANLLSCYKVATISRACAVVQSRKKSEKRGVGVRHPRHLRRMVCIVSGFFTTMKGRLFIPLWRDEKFRHPAQPARLRDPRREEGQEPHDNSRLSLVVLLGGHRADTRHEGLRSGQEREEHHIWRQRKGQVRRHGKGRQDKTDHERNRAILQERRFQDKIGSWPANTGGG